MKGRFVSSKLRNRAVNPREEFFKGMSLILSYAGLVCFRLYNSINCFFIINIRPAFKKDWDPYLLPANRRGSGALPVEKPSRFGHAHKLGRRRVYGDRLGFKKPLQPEEWLLQKIPGQGS